MPAFTDDAEMSGLRFSFSNGATPERQIPETMSGGVGLLDYDGDGWLDVYVVQGGPFPPQSQGAVRHQQRAGIRGSPRRLATGSSTTAETALLKMPRSVPVLPGWPRAMATG